MLEIECKHESIQQLNPITAMNVVSINRREKKIMFQNLLSLSVSRIHPCSRNLGFDIIVLMHASWQAILNEKFQTHT